MSNRSPSATYRAYDVLYGNKMPSAGGTSADVMYGQKIAERQDTELRVYRMSLISGGVGG